MNINFYNNITDKKNPTIIVVSNPSDLLNVNKLIRPLISKLAALKLFFLDGQKRKLTTGQSCASFNIFSSFKRKSNSANHCN